MANEACPVTDVVVLVVFGQVENILRQQFSLRGEGTRKEGGRTVKQHLIYCVTCMCSVGVYVAVDLFERV